MNFLIGKLICIPIKKRLYTGGYMENVNFYWEGNNTLVINGTRNNIYISN